jgi:NAD(P)-dependent dehydrogenase (short-subunit alcohol dehydrogenase family)
MQHQAERARRPVEALHSQTEGRLFWAHAAVNHLSHFLLASLLMERLKASGTAEATARVVAVSSICHSWEEMDFDDLNCDNKPYEK